MIGYVDFLCRLYMPFVCHAVCQFCMPFACHPHVICMPVVCLSDFIRTLGRFDFPKFSLIFSPGVSIILFCI